MNLSDGVIRCAHGEVAKLRKSKDRHGWIEPAAESCTKCAGKACGVAVVDPAATSPWRPTGDLSVAQIAEFMTNPASKDLRRRVVAVVNLLVEAGLVEEEGRKQWAIDQALRELLGPRAYGAVIADASEKASTEWSEGTAP